MCSWCLRGETHLCVSLLPAALAPRFSLGGEPVFPMTGVGSFAEETVVSAVAAIPFEEDVPWEVAALIGCAVTTGVGAAVNTARVEPGSSVAVVGLGGVGLSVVLGARLCGAAEIVGVDLSRERLELARRLGATHAAPPEDAPGLVQELTRGEGVDYGFEAVGRPETIRLAWELARRGGSVVVVGAGSPGARVDLSAFDLFYPAKKVLGCVYGGADVRREYHRLIRLWRYGRLDLGGLVTSRSGLEGVEEALRAMREGRGARTVLLP